jgi:pSer/pThr/pTyr-binding forkhead associated (FHA) protein
MKLILIYVLVFSTSCFNEIQISFSCRPYLLDLESTNGSFINKIQIKPKRFYEVKHKDVIKFGESTREYVFLKEDEK